MDFEKITQTILSLIPTEAIIVFGSYAWGTPDEDSDLDLFVVSESDEDEMIQTAKINNALFPRNYSLDLIVVTRKHLLDKSLNHKFVKRILQNGKALYHRS